MFYTHYQDIPTDLTTTSASLACQTPVGWGLAHKTTLVLCSGQGITPLSTKPLMSSRDYVRDFTQHIPVQRNNPEIKFESLHNAALFRRRNDPVPAEVD